MGAGRPVALEGQGVALPGGVGGGSGEGAADLLAVHADGVLRVPQIGVLADLQQQRVGTRAGRKGDGVGGRGGGLGEGEGARRRIVADHLRRAGHRLAVVGGAVDVEVAVGGRGAAPGVVEELDRDRVVAGGPVALEGEGVGLSGGVGGGSGEGAADLLAVDAHRVLRRALVGVLADLQDQRVGTGAGRERGRGGGWLRRLRGGRRAAAGEGLHGWREVLRQGVGDDGGVGPAHVLGVRRAAAPIHPRQVVGGHVDAGGRAVRHRRPHAVEDRADVSPVVADRHELSSWWVTVRACCRQAPTTSPLFQL